MTCPELPSRVSLGLRCLHFGTSRVAMATWGTASAPFPRLGTRSHKDDSYVRVSHELTVFNP